MEKKVRNRSVEEKNEGKNGKKRAREKFCKMVIALCGFCLDVGLIIYIELIQLISVLTLVYLWGNQLNKLHIIEILVICIFSILLLRHFAIKGMPSTKLIKLVQEELKIKKE